MRAGDGIVDYLIGGAYADELHGQDGMDLVFGDHASISLYSDETHKLHYATTIEASCTPGADTIYLGAGDDIAFGGALGDVIMGEGGQDVILGDFGLYDAEVEFLPDQNFESVIDENDSAGSDFIDGGDDSDILMGQEGDDTIQGGAGSDDIYGGHHKRHGSDGSDLLSGGDGDDVIVGDNGEILRKRLSYSSNYPWTNGMVWQMYPSPFSTEIIRDTRRYDDIDNVFGDDRLFGEAGNDILHGGRGDDYLEGGDGEDGKNTAASKQALLVDRPLTVNSFCYDI